MYWNTVEYEPTSMGEGVHFGFQNREKFQAYQGAVLLYNGKQMPYNVHIKSFTQQWEVRQLFWEIIFLKILPTRWQISDTNQGGAVGNHWTK